METGRLSSDYSFQSQQSKIEKIPFFLVFMGNERSINMKKREKFIGKSQRFFFFLILTLDKFFFFLLPISSFCARLGKKTTRRACREAGSGNQILGS